MREVMVGLMCVWLGGATAWAHPGPTSRPVSKRLKKTVFQGVLEGANRRPMAFAHVKLQRFWFSSERSWIRVDHRGRWKLEVKKPGLYWLSFSGLMHATQKVAVWVEAGKHRVARFRVRLSALRWRKRLRRVRLRVIGGSPSAPTLRYIPMKRRSDGSYFATLTTRKRQLRYQLWGVANQATAGAVGAFVYSPVYGPYHSLVTVPDGGRVTIRWKPPAGRFLPKSPALVRSTPAWGLALHQILKAYNAEKLRAYRGYRAWRRKRRRRSARYIHKWRPALKRIRQQWVTPYPRPFLKRALQLLQFHLPYRDFTYFYYENVVRSRRLVEGLSPRSPLWSLSSGLVYKVLSRTRMGAKWAPTQKLLRGLAHHPNPMVPFQYTRRKIRSLLFYQRYYGNKYEQYKRYLAARRRRIPGLDRQLQQLLGQYRGETFDGAVQEELQKQLRGLLQSQRRRRLMVSQWRRYARYYRSYFAKFRRQPQHYRNEALALFQKLRRLSLKHRQSRTMARAVKYLSWKLFLRYRPGFRVPAFRLPLLASQGVWTRRRFLGKVTLMVFWATWCGPCVRKLPKLHRAHRMYRRKGLQILSISLDSSVAKVMAFRRRRWKMPWFHALLQGDTKTRIKNLFRIRGIPHMLLIGPRGKVLANDKMLRSRFFSLLQAHVASRNPS